MYIQNFISAIFLKSINLIGFILIYIFLETQYPELTDDSSTFYLFLIIAITYQILPKFSDLIIAVKEKYDYNFSSFQFVACLKTYFIPRVLVFLGIISFSFITYFLINDYFKILNHKTALVFSVFIFSQLTFSLTRTIRRHFSEDGNWKFSEIDSMYVNDIIYDKSIFHPVYYFTEKGNLLLKSNDYKLIDELIVKANEFNIENIPFSNKEGYNEREISSPPIPYDVIIRKDNVLNIWNKIYSVGNIEIHIGRKVEKNDYGSRGENLPSNTRIYIGLISEK